jgi:hypothetical protein
MAATQAEKVLELIRTKGVVRAREVTERGFHPEYLRRLREEGLIERVARGVYVPANQDPGAHQTLADAAKRVLRGIICLLSALRFDEIGTQSPHQRSNPVVSDVRAFFSAFPGEFLPTGRARRDLRCLPQQAVTERFILAREPLAPTGCPGKAFGL